MNDNKIKIGVAFDATEINKQIADLQKKIKGMREFSSTGPISQLAQQYRSSGDDRRAKQLEEFRQRQDTQNRKVLLQDLERQKKSLDDLLDREKRINQWVEARQKNEQDVTKQLEAQAKLKAEIYATAVKQSAVEKEINSKVTSDYASVKLDPKAMGKFGGGGGGGLGGLVSGLGLSKILGLAGTAMSYGGNLAYQIGTQRSREVRSEAGIAGALGEVSELQSRRRGYETNFYGPERLKALEAGRKEMQFAPVKDVTSLIGTILKSAAGGAVAGGAATMLGGPLTAAGGAVAGGIVGGISGFAGSMLDERKRSMIFDRDYYKKMITESGFKTYQEQLEYEKAKNFDKVRAQEYLEQNKGRIQGLQRSFGMSDTDLFMGGESLFQRGAKAGFTTDTITSAMQAISGAGGTSRAAREGGIYAAQMSRGLNLTNAGELLGKISGATGMGAEGSKDQLIRMYAEATRIGLDASEFAKETRTFLDTAATMAYESGASFKDTAGLLGEGVGLYSERGIAASRSALEKLRQETGAMGGLTGQYQIGELQSEKMKQILGGNLNLEETAMLSGMDISRVSLEDDYVKTLLQRRGIGADSDQAKQFVEEVKQGKVRSGLRSPEQLKAYEDYQRLKNTPMASPEALMEAESRARELGVLTGGEAEARMGIQEQKAFTRMKAGVLGGGTFSDVTQTGQAFEQMMLRDTGKITDKMEGAQAQDDLAQLQRLTEKSGELSEAFSKTTAQGVRLSDVMSKLAESVEKNEKIFEAYSNIMKQTIESSSTSARDSVNQLMPKEFLIFGNNNR